MEHELFIMGRKYSVEAAQKILEKIINDNCNDHRVVEAGNGFLKMLTGVDQNNVLVEMIEDDGGNIGLKLSVSEETWVPI